MDLEKFFDTVCQSKLIEVLSRTIKDGRVISLIHKYLNAGVIANGMFERTEVGMPQGGPLSPLLSNVMLNECGVNFYDTTSIDSMTEELTNMQNQIKEMQEDTLINNAKKALSEAQERLNTRCEQIKSQVFQVKVQVKSTAKSIVDESKVKGREALYRVSEFLGIKNKLLNIRENVRGVIRTTDKDIAKTALLGKGLRE